MCGIGVLYESTESGLTKSKIEDALRCIANRGPDGGDATVLDNGMALLASVLHLRGLKCTRQPFRVRDCKDVLLWNGEVFGGHPVVSSTQSDTRRVFQVLSSLTRTDNNIGKNLLKSLDRIEGPWSVVYWHNDSQTLWFGRDRLGRRSLLLRYEKGDDDDNVLKSLRISSVLSVHDDEKYVVPTDKDRYKMIPSVWQAIPPIGLFGVRFKNDGSLHGFIHVPRTSSLLPSSSAAVVVTTKKTTGETTTKSSLSSCLEQTLRDAVKRRALDISDSKGVAVLFSGGLDSAVIAAMLGQVLPKDNVVELINVCFDYPTYNSPDRDAALRVFQELKVSQPKRKWRLILVNVTWKEVQEQARRVMNLIRPRETQMDFNIAIAMWFAARGRGILASSLSSTPVPYISKARVLLLGIGADEQLGGYQRHRSQLQLKGEDGLREEMQMDVKRLWRRNLGRDDRVVSDLGKEIRLPYLDESVTKLISSTPLRDLVGTSESSSFVNKKVLRDVAVSLGIKYAASLKKRAIQFGSRIAKRSGIHIFGSVKKANRSRAGVSLCSLSAILGDGFVTRTTSCSDVDEKKEK